MIFSVLVFVVVVNAVVKQWKVTPNDGNNETHIHKNRKKRRNFLFQNLHQLHNTEEIIY